MDRGGRGEGGSEVPAAYNSKTIYDNETENERLQTIKGILCFTPARKPPHLYKFFQFSKCHLAQSANDKLCKNSLQTMGSACVNTMSSE